MNIAFFHTGDNIIQPEMLCRSARKVFKGQNLKITHITNNITPKVDSADQIFRTNGLNGLGIMHARMISYRDYLKTFREPTVFLDTDMLIIRRFILDLSKGPKLCQRSYGLNTCLKPYIIKDKTKILFPEFTRKSFGKIFPYVGCFFADKDEFFIDKALSIYEKLDERYKLWYGDQIALKEAALQEKVSSIKEKHIACDPHDYNKAKHPVAILHFKGGDQKALMKDFFLKLFPDEDYLFRGAIT